MSSSGHPASYELDYKQKGSTFLFAALEVNFGIVQGIWVERSISQDSVHFLDQLEDELPKDKEKHLVKDNYAKNKNALFKEWLNNLPRFHFYFTPTSSSWLSRVKRLFRELTDNCVRRSSLNFVDE
ncbi:MAG: transposase [Deltaproteobacteria bacterium]|nr:transposase [Deltaproteobacteria bacterium]